MEITFLYNRFRLTIQYVLKKLENFIIQENNKFVCNS